jgi:hypothetical protein
MLRRRSFLAWLPGWLMVVDWLRGPRLPPALPDALTCASCSRPMAVDEIAGWDNALTHYCERCAMRMEQQRSIP